MISGHPSKTAFRSRLRFFKRLPTTLELAILAFLLANAIALPLGALAALRHRRTTDIAISTLATILGAIPNFWLATLLVLVFSLR